MKKLVSMWIGKVLNTWADGASYLLYDSSISFYTFFSLIFSECAYLWAFYNSSLAFKFTIILLGYIFNVIICAWLKGLYEGNRKELVFTVLYVVDFIFLFILGCFINIAICTVLTVIPLAITALCILIREFTLCIFITPHLSFWKKTVNLVDKLLELTAVVAPFIIFALCLAQIDTLHIALKIIISVLYFFCVPFISYYEDDTSALNIFELAYDIT